jgi:hypothetical protein
MPEMPVLDVMKEVGRRWRTLDDPGKVYFQKKADLDKI